MALLLLAPLFASCRHKPAVTLEQIGRETEIEPRVDLSRRVFAPRCDEIPIPAYPEDVPPDRRPERVSVRAEFTLGTDGRAGHVRAATLRPVALEEPYLRATLEAIASLECEPAWSPPAPHSGSLERIKREYRSSLVFHFHRDEREVGVGDGTQ